MTPHVLKVKELRKTLGIANRKSKGLIIEKQVINTLAVLGLKLINWSNRGCVTLKNLHSSQEKWWQNWELEEDERDLTWRYLITQEGREKCLICMSLSSLQKALSKIKESKLDSRLSRKQEDKIRNVSPWGTASAIVLLRCLDRRLYVVGVNHHAPNWSCEWMLGNPDERRVPDERFEIDLPLKLLKGSSVKVLRNGEWAVQIDEHKVLKMARVTKESDDSLRIDVLQTGAGRPCRIYRHGSTERQFSRWRPFSSVLFIGKANGAIARSYAKSGSTVYVK